MCAAQKSAKVLQGHLYKPQKQSRKTPKQPRHNARQIIKTDSIITWAQDSVAVLNRLVPELVTKLKHTKQPRHISQKVPKQDSN